VSMTGVVSRCVLAAALLTAAVAPYEGPVVAGATAGSPLAAAPAGASSAEHEELRPLHVIAIDVSGSTVTTDPSCLSVSIARMTVDLLTPGRVALITFAGERATHVGTYDLGAESERQAAQQKLDELQRACSGRDGATPLADALSLAWDVMDKEGAPAGSSVYLLTDGKPEPDTQKQYDAIRALAPRFRERGWRVMAVGLEQPGDPWVQDLAAALNGAEAALYAADNMTEVREYFLALYQQVTGQTTLNLHDGPINPIVGAVDVPVKIDPTMREVTLIAFHEQPVRFRLFLPDGKEVGFGDALIERVSARDSHYTLVQLQGDLPPGQWRVVLEGGGNVGLRAVCRSALALEIIAPPDGGRLPLGAPGDIQARLRNTETGDVVFEPATLVAELRDANGGVASVQLLDDGNAATGDAAKADGTYSGRLVLSTAGLAELAVRVDSPSFSVNSRTAISVESFPSLVLKGPTVLQGIERGSAVDLALNLQVDGAPYSAEFISDAQAKLLTPSGGIVVSEIEPVSVKGDKIVFRVKPGEGGSDDSAQYTLFVQYSGTYKGSPFTLTYVSSVLQFYLVPPSTPWRLYASLAGGALLAAALSWATTNYWRRPRRIRAGFVDPVSGRSGARISLQPALRRLSILNLALCGRYVARSEVIPGLPRGLMLGFGRKGEVFVRRRLPDGNEVSLSSPGNSPTRLGNQWHRLRAGERLAGWGRDVEFRPA